MRIELPSESKQKGGGYSPIQVEITEGKLLNLSSLKRVRGEEGWATRLHPLTECYCTIGQVRHSRLVFLATSSVQYLILPSPFDRLSHFVDILQPLLPHRLLARGRRLQILRRSTLFFYRLPKHRHLLKFPN